MAAGSQVGEVHIEEYLPITDLLGRPLCRLGGVILKEVFGQVLIEPDLAVLLG